MAVKKWSESSLRLPLTNAKKKTKKKRTLAYKAKNNETTLWARTTKNTD